MIIFDHAQNLIDRVIVTDDRVIGTALRLTSSESDTNQITLENRVIVKLGQHD